MKNIFWTAYSNKPRIQAIHEIEIIVNNHGFITDFKQFSDISINIQIEIEEQKIEHLHKALSEFISVDKNDIPCSISKTERVVFLNITFSKSTGNLRIETPQVPG